MRCPLAPLRCWSFRCSPPSPWKDETGAKTVQKPRPRIEVPPLGPRPGIHMRIEISPSNTLHGTLILPLTQGDDVADASLTGVPSALKAQIANALSDGDFKGKKGEILSLVGTGEGRALLVGLGKAKDLDRDVWREIGAKSTAAMKPSHGKEFTVAAEDGDMHDLAAMAEGMMLRDYSYDVYLTKDDDDDEDDSEAVVRFACEDEDTEPLAAIVERMASVVTGVHRSRDLGNCPPNDLYPMAYARQAMEYAEDFERLNVSVITYEEALERGMGGLVAVGMGSSRKPCMVIFELNANITGRAPVIVGKGITFDTGGISIKPSPSMDEMKYDMGGSAVVFGLMQALTESGWEGKVTGIACMAENMPAANAQRPGDVIRTYSGKTIEVLNTDAEGRLVLSDGLWKAGEYDPEYIIDLATLTGACVVALGHEASGLWSNDDDLRSRIHDAGNAVGELAWPMPLLPAFEKEMTDSKIADTRNLGAGRWGGANTAAAFLKQFVPSRGEGDEEEQIPWAHLDIAGTFWGAKTNATVKHGATGVHVRTLHRLITGE
ncbi:MAG: leucyl aminopeptidase [Euryarchaeota archaeon]|nr:leucyl aminopeptidase [Euryarchaeota archaeon]